MNSFKIPSIDLRYILQYNQIKKKNNPSTCSNFSFFYVWENTSIEPRFVLITRHNELVIYWSRRKFNWNKREMGEFVICQWWRSSNYRMDNWIRWNEWNFILFSIIDLSLGLTMRTMISFPFYLSRSFPLYSIRAKYRNDYRWDFIRINRKSRNKTRRALDKRSIADECFQELRK